MRTKINYHKQKVILGKLIDENPRSEHINKYYSSIFAVLMLHRDSVLESVDVRRERPQSLPRGTVRLRIGQRTRNSKEEQIFLDLEEFAERYLREHQDGPLVDLAMSQLLVCYIGRNPSRHQEVARSLSQSKDTTTLIRSNEYLAIYAISEKRFREAATCYEEIIKNIAAGREKYFLYLANCFYEMGDIDSALVTLRKINSTDSSEFGRTIQDIAGVWEKEYIKFRTNPSIEKKAFVLVEF